MGSVGIPNSWAPYQNYGDCSQGICSIYCPQWCYIIFPPPPPPDDDDEDPANTFSPLIIVVIGILATAFLLVGYYTIVSKYCRRRGGGDRLESDRDRLTQNQLQQQQQQMVLASSGLDEALIESIAIFKFKKGNADGGLIEGTDCAICLSDFQENESLRLMPTCNHAFHLPCIDTWLKSHPNCPLCRSNVVSASDPSSASQFPPTPPPPHPPTSQHSSSTSSSSSSSSSSSTLNMSSFETQPRNEVIVVVDDAESGHRHQQGRVVLSLFTDLTPKINPCPASELRRSVSLDSHRPLLVADILRGGEDDDDENFRRGNRMASRSSRGQSSGEQRESNNGIGDRESYKNYPSTVRRSISTGRFLLTKKAKGENSCVIPD